MAVKYFCDKCGNKIERSFDAVKIIGGRDIDVLCESCWLGIESLIVNQKETLDVNKK